MNTKNPKVYKIHEFTIAADNAGEALGFYLEEGYYDLLDVVPETLDDGESFELSIKITQLTPEELLVKDINCCDEDVDDCDYCADKDGVVKLSLKDILEKTSNFPALLAKES